MHYQSLCYAIKAKRACVFYCTAILVVLAINLTTLACYIITLFLEKLHTLRHSSEQELSHGHLSGLSVVTVFS